MKKVILSVIIVAGFSLANAQINLQSEANVSISKQNPFLDASKFVDFGNNTGKGLYFPRTDLTKWEFKTDQLGKFNLFKTAFDGMVVYNTGTGKVGQNVEGGYLAKNQGLEVDVEPGFYYFYNPSADPKAGYGAGATDISEGYWVRIMDNSELSIGVENGKFWTLKGNSGTDAAVDYLGTTDAQNLVMKVNVDKEGLEQAVTDKKIEQEDMDNYNPTKLILGNAVDAPAFTKVVIGGTPKEQEAALATRIKNVQPDGQKEAANFKFVLEVFGKARFANGLVTSASTYPDYVFDNYFTGKSDVNPDYKFKKLNEVEAFIKENNHLPGVTKIDDLAKTESGYEVDNTQLSIQTLEKVEELYLHLIEQQKEIQALKAQIAELKK